MATKKTTTFERGDTVRLRSGGPLMTVKHRISVSEHTVYVVMWFDLNQQLREENFASYMLQFARV